MPSPNTLALTDNRSGHARVRCDHTKKTLVAAPAANHLRVVDALWITSVHANVVGEVTVYIRDDTASPTDDFVFENQRRIPLKTKLNILDGRSLYLNEGESLVVQGNVDEVGVNVVNATAPYSDCQ